MLGNFFSYRELVLNLVSRDLKVRYKRSVLGIAWAFFEPLLLMFLFTLVFSLLLKVKIKDYPAFVLCGIIPWNFFLSGVTYSLTSVINNKNLVKKIYFPKEVLPASIILGRLVNFALSLVLLVPFFIYYRIPVSINILYLPAIIIIQLMLVMGLALLFSGLNTFYDDVSFLLNFLFFGMFYLTPVFYSVDMVPERFRAGYMLNPMAVIINSYRDVLIYGRPPNFHDIALCFFISLFLLFFGYKVFKGMEQSFAEVL